MDGLRGKFEKVYSLAAQSFLMRKNGVFNRVSSSSRQAFGQLGRAVENSAVRSVPFLLRSRQYETDWVEICVFLCL